MNMVLFFKIMFTTQFCNLLQRLILPITVMSSQHINKNTVSVLFQGRFFGLFALFTIAEDPVKYNLTPYQNTIYIMVFVLVFIGTLTFLLKDLLTEVSVTIFYYFLQFSLSRKFVCYYCYMILHVRGFFEFEYLVIPLLFGAPNVLFLINWCLELIPLFSNWFLLMLLWFSIGMTLLTWDQIGARVDTMLKEHPTDPFSTMFETFLAEKRSVSPFLHAALGLGTLKKLSAAGQAAIFAGATAALTGISVAAINVWYNDRKDQRVAEQKEKDRQAYAEQEEKKRQAYAEQEEKKHQAYAEQEEKKRQAQAAEARKDREAKKERKTAKYAENEAQRKHEKEHWAHEVIEKEKARQAELDKQKNKKWYQK